MKPKISCICPTRGRFGVLRESISFFLLQDYPNKELIIFNNHPEPIIPHPKLIKHNIKVINAGDYSGKSMELVYAHAIKYISEDSEYVAIWDDDDMYFPWHLSDNIYKLISSEKKAIRAKYGYWQDIHSASTDEFLIIRNTLEASMIGKKGCIFFNEDNKEKESPEFTHPHTSWVVKTTSEDGYFYNDRITAVFRWNYGQKYHHLQSVGPHKNNEDTGVGSVLRPTRVGHLFHNFIQKVHLTTDAESGVICLATDKKVELYKNMLDAGVEKFDCVDKYKVWLYWNSSDIPAFLKLCEETIRGNTFFEVVRLNDEMLKKYELPDYVWSLGAVQRSDYVRVYFLKNYGGSWFDSDTIVVGNMDEHYLKYLTNHETVFPWEYSVTKNMTASMYSSKPHSVVFNQAMKNIEEYFKSNPNIGWAGIGINGIIKATTMLKDRGEGYYFGLPDIAMFGCNNSFVEKWDFTNMSPDKLRMIILHWSEIASKLSHFKSEEEIMNAFPNLKHAFDLSKKSY